LQQAGNSVFAAAAAGVAFEKRRFLSLSLSPGILLPFDAVTWPMMRSRFCLRLI
jgi:hypothetical protein